LAAAAGGLLSVLVLVWQGTLEGSHLVPEQRLVVMGEQWV